MSIDVDEDGEKWTFGWGKSRLLKWSIWIDEMGTENAVRSMEYGGDKLLIKRPSRNQAVELAGLLDEREKLIE